MHLTTNRLIVSLPAQLHHQLKVAAAQHGVTMTALAQEALETRLKTLPNTDMKKPKVNE